MNSNATLAQQPANGDLLSYATLGKTVLALLLVIAVILFCAAMVRRWAPGAIRSGPRQLLKVVSSVAVGQRERVVIVEVEQRWLVLGVAAGQVTRLHDMPAPPPTTPEQAAGERSGFGAELRHALGKSGKS